MKKGIWLTVAGLLLVLLAFVLSVLIPILSHENKGSSGQLRPEGYPSEVEATGADARTRHLEATYEDGSELHLESIKTGEIITVKGSGYDSKIGIYVGFCLVPDSPEQRPSPCLGGIPEDAQEEKEEGISSQALESAWVTDNWAWKAFASHSYTDPATGSFEVKLIVPPSATEGLDCRSKKCGIYTRADHTALSERVQDVYLPFAFAD